MANFDISDYYKNMWSNKLSNLENISIGQEKSKAFIKNEEDLGVYKSTLTLSCKGFLKQLNIKFENPISKIKLSFDNVFFYSKEFNKVKEVTIDIPYIPLMSLQYSKLIIHSNSAIQEVNVYQTLVSKDVTQDFAQRPMELLLYNKIYRIIGGQFGSSNYDDELEKQLIKKNVNNFS